MVSCQGCGEETTERLCCPQCKEVGRLSFFCSQECFSANWSAHNELHGIMRKAHRTSDQSKLTKLSEGNEQSTVSRSSPQSQASQSRLSQQTATSGEVVEESDTSSKWCASQGTSGAEVHLTARRGPSLPVVGTSTLNLNSEPRVTPSESDVPGRAGGVPSRDGLSLSRFIRSFVNPQQPEELPLHLLSKEGKAASTSFAAPPSRISREKDKSASSSSSSLMIGSDGASGMRPGSLQERRLSIRRLCWLLVTLSGVCCYLWFARSASQLDVAVSSASDIDSTGAPFSDSQTLNSADLPVSLRKSFVDLQTELADLRQEMVTLSGVVQQHSFLWSLLATPPFAKGASSAAIGKSKRGSGAGSLGEAVANRFNGSEPSSLVASAIAPDAPLYKLLALLAEEEDRDSQKKNNKQGNEERLLPPSPLTHKSFQAGVAAEEASATSTTTDSHPPMDKEQGLLRSEESEKGLETKEQRDADTTEVKKEQEATAPNAALKTDQTSQEKEESNPSTNNGGVQDPLQVQVKREEEESESDSWSERKNGKRNVQEDKWMFSQSLYSGELSKNKRPRRIPASLTNSP